MVLRNVPKTDTFEQQRQELNELAVDVFNLKQQVDTFNLDDLVDVTAAGATNSQIIKYNGTEWVLDTDIVSTSFTVINASLAVTLIYHTTIPMVRLHILHQI